MKGVKKASRYLPLFLLIAGFVVAFAPAVLAQEGLTVCSGLNCQFCHVAGLIQKIIRFLIILAAPIAAILFAWAGILYFSSAASEDNIHKAKDIFKSAFIGFIIALTAYLVVEVALRTLVKREYVGNWNTIQCVGNRPGTVPATPRSGGGSSVIPAAITSPTGTTGSQTCTNCSQITALSVKPGAGNQVEGEYNLRLGALAENLDDFGLKKENLTISEGWPPTVVHKNSCHSQGTCTDGSLRGVPYTPQTVSSVQKAADRADLCAVYEPAAGKSCSGYEKCLALSTTQADHFSIYKKGAAGCI